VRLALKNRLPLFYQATGDGVLISYAVDSSDLFRRAASYIDRILRGAKPGELPVQYPTRFRLVVNLKAAKAMVRDSAPSCHVDPVDGCAPGSMRMQTAREPTFDPREEPGALAAPAGICAGGVEQSSSLPRPSQQLPWSLCRRSPTERGLRGGLGLEPVAVLVWSEIWSAPVAAHPKGNIGVGST
jgi:ABC transporter substrate binding protein